MAKLVDAFCDRQRQQRHDPFKPTTVVVQSFGIGQWLKVRLAEQSGISANVECILPAELIWRFYQSLIPAEKLPNESPFARHLMTWQVMKLLPSATGEQFAQVQRYLDGDDSQL
ncbi:MAG: exodeoxyribonuclease V subunit gamma, partial [Pseudomonadales bacterium]|nr:exodeoxyribonuclease V subunit gamma [Pseudomonadales bacterium]